jgi:hypothetical protein
VEELDLSTMEMAFTVHENGGRRELVRHRGGYYSAAETPGQTGRDAVQALITACLMDGHRPFATIHDHFGPAFASRRQKQVWPREQGLALARTIGTGNSLREFAPLEPLDHLSSTEVKDEDIESWKRLAARMTENVIVIDGMPWTRCHEPVYSVTGMREIKVDTASASTIRRFVDVDLPFDPVRDAWFWSLGSATHGEGGHYFNAAERAQARDFADRLVEARAEPSKVLAAENRIDVHIGEDALLDAYRADIVRHAKRGYVLVTASHRKCAKVSPGLAEGRKFAALSMAARDLFARITAFEGGTGTFDELESAYFDLAAGCAPLDEMRRQGYTAIDDAPATVIGQARATAIRRDQAPISLFDTMSSADIDFDL